MTIQHFTGDKLSSQSLVLGKKCFLEYGNNINDLIIKEHDLIKNIRAIV